MHLYNITFGVVTNLEPELLSWLRTEFIPVSVNDGQYFHSPEILRVHTNEPGAESIALQLRATSLDDINLWYEDHGARLFDYLQRHWEGQVVFFTTTLSKI